MRELHLADYVIFCLLLAVSAIVGPVQLFMDRKKRQTSESYFVGNRQLSFIPTAASLFASFWSAIALIGIPAELYTGGAKFFMSSIGQIIGIWLGAHYAVPLMYRLKLISTYQYIEQRYDSPFVRKLSTLAGILTSLFSLAVTTYAPCVALEAVTPIPIWASVIGVASITMIYTVLGGIRAVVIVDFIQAIVMFFGVLVATVMGFTKIEGGFSRAMDLAYEGGRLDFFDFNPDPRNTYSFWAMVVPQILFSAGIYATSQAAVQRYSALPTVKQATWSVLSMTPQILIFKIMLFFLSLAMFAYYDARGCDPLRGKLIENPNQLTTFFVVDVLEYPGLTGLWFAALFSGSLSTMSTGYNSVAAIIWEDFLKPHFDQKLHPRRISVILKLITLALGILSCLLALLFKYLSGSIIKLTMSTVSVFGAAVFICYLGGSLFPMINARGTVIGMIASTFFAGFLAGGQLMFRLGNEQVWLPTKTGNCSAITLTTQKVDILMKSSLKISGEMLGNNQTIAKNVAPISNTVWWRDPDNLPEPFLFLFSLSYFLFPFFAVLAGVLVAFLMSLLTGGLKSAKFVKQRYLLVPNCFASKSSPCSSLEHSNNDEEETSHPCCSGDEEAHRERCGNELKELKAQISTSEFTDVENNEDLSTMGDNELVTADSFTRVKIVDDCDCFCDCSLGNAGKSETI